MGTIIKLGGVSYVAGLNWRDADAQTIKADAIAEATSVGESSDAASAGYVVRKSDGQDNGDNGVYGVCLLPDAALPKKKVRLYSLATAVCDGLDDGLYVGLLSLGGDASGAGDMQAYWLLGVHGGLILPQTDQVFVGADELHGNVAMLRAMMPGLRLHVDTRIDQIFLSDQQGWNWADAVHTKKTRPIQFVTGAYSKGALASPLGKALKAAALVALVSGAGVGGWFYYQEHMVVRPPDPQVLAAQQMAAYEAHLQQMAARFHPAVLDERWGVMTRSLAASRVIGSGFRLSEFECGLESCHANFAAQVGLVASPQAVVDALGRSVGSGPVSILKQTPQQLSLTWPMQAATVSATPDRAPAQAPDARAWAQSLTPKAEALRGVEALQRPAFAAITAIAQLVPQPAGEAVSIIDQTSNLPPGEVGVQVATFTLNVPALALSTLPREIARTLGGQAAGIHVAFDADGLVTQARAQVIIAIRD